ncbi:MAG: 3-isopropylmalate dehydratase small subunit, partial [Methyloprofundus sp.]|nr:3-isopropylmalate dehydratase small subunit [Methyloprofundus sp.]
MDEVAANEGVQFIVDLENQELVTPAGNGFKFEVDPFRKNNLLKGLDDIGLTLEHTDLIDQYETKHKQAYPWLWA